MLAHDSVGDQIAVLTVLINESPGRPDLLLRRADLYRANRQWNEALADLDRATRLDPSVPSTSLIRAQLLLDWGRWREAADAAGIFLQQQPAQPTALVVRARARSKLGQARLAAADYSASLSVRPLPDLYIERSRLLTTTGADGLEQAVLSLDEGIARLGPVVTLELEAIDLEQRLRRFDAALARVDRVAAQAARQESWVARRGAILEAAGRLDEAVAAYRRALALAAAPGGRRTRATDALAAQLRSDLIRLEAQGKPQTVSRR